MNKCEEYLKLISAYADGELTESEIHRVEEHLTACENCSAILELYRGISDTIAESCVPAPDSLCGSVMEKVIRNRKRVTTTDLKRRKVIRIALTRFLPVAACLAVVLLALPRVMNVNRSVNDMASYSGGAGSAPKSESQMSSSAPAPSAAPGSSKDSGGYSSGGSAISGSGADTAAGGSSMYSAKGETGEPDAIENIQEDADYTNKDKPFPSDGSSAVSAPEESGGDSERGPALPENPAAGSQTGEDPQDTMSILNEFEGAYALIEISGELPELLNKYEAMALDGRYNWDVYYEIPREEAQALIKTLAARYGTETDILNENSKYAIVLYSPGG